MAIRWQIGNSGRTAINVHIEPECKETAYTAPCSLHDTLPISSACIVVRSYQTHHHQEHWGTSLYKCLPPLAHADDINDNSSTKDERNWFFGSLGSRGREPSLVTLLWDYGHSSSDPWLRSMSSIACSVWSLAILGSDIKEDQILDQFGP